MVGKGQSDSGVRSTYPRAAATTSYLGEWGICFPLSQGAHL